MIMIEDANLANQNIDTQSRPKTGVLVQNNNAMQKQRRAE